MGAKVEDETREEKKRRRLLSAQTTSAPVKFDASTRRLKRVAPIGDFKPDKKQGQLNVEGVVDDAMKMVSEGAPPDSTVSIILPDEKGQPATERHVPLKKVAELRDGSELYDKLEGKGGWVRFGDGDDGGASLRRKAAQAVYGFASKIILPRVESGEIPKKDAAKALARFAASAADTLSGGVSENELRAAVGAGAGVASQGQSILGVAGKYTVGGLMPANMPPRWFLISEASRVGYIWMMDQMKFRYQYSIVGKFLTIPWSRKRYYEEERKKHKKRKKMSDLEKRLDIFDINIEDIFDINTLSMEEVFELDDIDKVKPTVDEYRAMSKLMKEEGYYDYAEATSAFGEGEL